DEISISFVNDKTEELKMFRDKKLDMVFKLPLEMIDFVIGELDEAKKGDNLPFEMQVTPSMLIQYYGFQHKSEVFKDKNVRLAFNYAIDRDYIVDFIMQGDGKPVKYGFVPPAFADYEYDSLKSYSFNPMKARLFLSKAGYPGGKDFPITKIQLNSGGQNNIKVAEVIQEMLKENLNIEIELEVLPFAEHLEKVENGQANFWRSGWAADYPDPESFLNLFYGKHVPDSLHQRSYINAFRYQNPKYDSLYEKALQTVDKSERYRLYRLAEQTILDDGVVLPLYYDEFIRLLNPQVKNFPSNAMEYRDFGAVYIEPEES
ncbi:MAG: ABC transporter substrate-binding protein, partial [Flavobacteriales bacterium]|nr:ABC transporter substrate-binding protein [Flavobacteriales bacterium]